MRVKERAGFASWLVAAVVIAAGGVVGTAAPASAATVLTVTTTADTVDGGDGVLSLREAVGEAATASPPVEIRLATNANYELSRCGAAVVDEDSNTVGDLDLAPAGDVLIAGHGATVRQTCSTDRILDAGYPATAAVAYTVTLHDLTLADGKGSFVGALGSEAGLVLDGVVVAGTVTASSSSVGTAAVVVSRDAHPSFARPLRIDDSTFHDITGRAVADLATGGVVEITTSTFHDITSPGSGSDIDAMVMSRNRSITVTDSTFADSSGAAVAVGIMSSTPQPVDLTLERTDVHGLADTTRAVVWSQGSLHLTDTAIVGNDAALPLIAASSTVVRSTISDNTGSLVTAALGKAVIEDSTIARNSALAVGGVSVGGESVIRNSTIAPTVGTSITVENTRVASHLVIDRSTIVTADPAPTVGREIRVGNVANPFPVSVEIRGSVLGRPTGGAGAPVCGLQAPELPVTWTVSWSLVGDASCGGGTGVVAGQDPQLGPLGDNGGPTETRQPVAGSPVVDALPASSGHCALTDADQRGVARPQGVACDIGAVEARLGGFHPVTPARIFDTREASGGAAPLGPGAIRVVPVAGHGGIPADHAAAVVANVTATNGDAASHLTLWPTNRAMPDASNLNWAAGETVANLVTVALSPDGTLTVRNNSGSTHVIVDVAGWYDDGALPTICPCGDGYGGILPTRVLDTRTGAPLAAGVARDLAIAGVAGVPADATAVIANVTVVKPTKDTHLTVWPKGQVLPPVSNVNAPVGSVVPNLVIVKVGPDGMVRLRNNSGSADVLVDVVGWFGPPGALRFRAVTPSRFLDTRTSSPLTTITRLFPTPEAMALSFNLTATQGTAATHLTAWAGGLTMPGTSTLNLTAGQTRANHAIVTVGSAHQLALRNNTGTIHAIADLAGYFA